MLIFQHFCEAQKPEQFLYHYLQILSFSTATSHFYPNRSSLFLPPTYLSRVAFQRNRNLCGPFPVPPLSAFARLRILKKIKTSLNWRSTCTPCPRLLSCTLLCPHLSISSFASH
jgi:hypothetical protein